MSATKTYALDLRQADTSQYESNPFVARAFKNGDPADFIGRARISRDKQHVEVEYYHSVPKYVHELVPMLFLEDETDVLVGLSVVAGDRSANIHETIERFGVGKSILGQQASAPTVSIGDLSFLDSLTPEQQSELTVWSADLFKEIKSAVLDSVRGKLPARRSVEIRGVVERIGNEPTYKVNELTARINAGYNAALDAVDATIESDNKGAIQ